MRVLSCWAIGTLVLSLIACGGGDGGGGNSPGLISVAFSPQPPASVTAGSSTSIVAVVTNDTSNSGIQWTVTCASSNCGTISPSTTASVSATTYMAPATAPSPNTITITATSIANSSASVSATIAIGTAAPVLADGKYVFHVGGQDINDSPYYVAGVFVVQGGAITGGEQDFTDLGIEQTNTLNAANCRLTTTQDGNIQLVLDTSNTSIGVNGLETFTGTAVSSSRVLISQFDPSAAGSGSIDLQTSAIMPNGGYVFTLSGLDASQAPLGIGGVLNFSGSALATTSSAFDVNGNNLLLQGQTFTSGSVTAPDSFGRVIFSLKPSPAQVTAISAAGYMINANRIQLIEIADTLNGTTAGIALGQGSNAGTFNTASLASSSYVFRGGGEDINLNPIQLAGVLTFGTGGVATGSLSVNEGASQVANATITSATYTVDPTGRVTVSSVLFGQPVTFAFQLYLDGSGNALELGIDNFEVSGGTAYLQSLTSAAFAGSYGMSASGIAGVSPNPLWAATGPVKATSGALSGFSDYNVVTGTPITSIALTGTATGTPGVLTGAITGLNATSSATPGNYVYYMVDSTRIIGIEVDNLQLGLITFEAASN
jgi:hypothetical protein